MIRFSTVNAWKKAKFDIQIFLAWEKGDIETTQACKLVCENNSLPYVVTDEEFVRTAWGLGYFRK